jgi:hypothetical protein
MRIVLNGHRVGRGDEACYYRNSAFFTKRGLNKRNVLHELYHHLVYVNGFDMTKTKEERAANSYARDFLRESFSKRHKRVHVPILVIQDRKLPKA